MSFSRNIFYSFIHRAQKVSPTLCGCATYVFVAQMIAENYPFSRHVSSFLTFPIWHLNRTQTRKYPFLSPNRPIPRQKHRACKTSQPASQPTSSSCPFHLSNFTRAKCDFCELKVQRSLRIVIGFCRPISTVKEGGKERVELDWVLG